MFYLLSHPIIVATLFYCTCTITPLWAQQGPFIECVDCEGLNNKALPVSGRWYNPNQSGTGYILDVQNNYVAGLYFGYDVEGNPLWLSFQGALEVSEDSGTSWTLEVPFTKVSNGNAFNQPYQFPDLEETEDVIKLDFHFAHYASVQVNEGAVQHIIPANFAVSADQDFEETDQSFADLEGVWYYVFKLNDGPDNELGLTAYAGRNFYIFEKGMLPLADDGTKTIYYPLYRISAPYDDVPLGSLQCSNPFNESGQRKVKCWLEFISSSSPSNGIVSLWDGTMTVAPGNIGPNYIYAENELGDVFEAFRVDYFSVFGLEP